MYAHGIEQPQVVKQREYELPQMAISPCGGCHNQPQGEWKQWRELEERSRWNASQKSGSDFSSIT